jgi:hypothetical protein
MDLALKLLIMVVVVVVNFFLPERSEKLTWQVPFYRCAHLPGRTSSTFTRKV